MTYEENQANLEQNRYQESGSFAGSLFNMGITMPYIANATSSGLSSTHSFYAQTAILDQALTNSYKNSHYFGGQFFGNPITKAYNKLFRNETVTRNYAGGINYVASSSNLKAHKDPTIQRMGSFIDNMSQKMKDGGMQFTLENDMLQTGWGYSNRNKSAPLRALRTMAGETSSTGIDNPKLYDIFRNSSDLKLEEVIIAGEKSGDAQKAFKTILKDNVGQNFTKENIAKDIKSFQTRHFSMRSAKVTGAQMDNYVSGIKELNTELEKKFMNNLSGSVEKAGIKAFDETAEGVATSELSKKIKNQIVDGLTTKIDAQKVVLEKLQKATETLSNPQISAQIKKEQTILDNLIKNKEIISKKGNLKSSFFKKSAKTIENEFAEEAAEVLTKRTGAEKFLSNPYMRFLTGSGAKGFSTAANIGGAVIGAVAAFRQQNAVSNYVSTALTRGTSDDMSFLQNEAAQHSIQKHMLHSQDNLQELSRIYASRNTSNELRAEISPFYDSIMGNYEFTGIEEFETS